MTTTAATSSSSPTASLIEQISPPSPTTQQPRPPPTPPPLTPNSDCNNHQAQSELNQSPRISEQQEHFKNSPTGPTTRLLDQSTNLDQHSLSSSSAASPKSSQETSLQTEPPKQLQQQSPDQQIQSKASPNSQQQDEARQQSPPNQISDPSPSASSSSQSPNQQQQTQPAQQQTQSRPSPIEEPQSDLQKQQQQISDAPVTAIAASHSNCSNNSSNNTEQKRPMNAFLLFCKRQRSLVKEKYPNLENRSITKILGDWWSKLEKEQKDKYTELARQHKEAFMKANPDFKWCKTPVSSNTNNSESASNSSNNNITNSNPNRNDNCYIATHPHQINRDSMSNNDHMHQNRNHLNNPFTNLNHLSQQQQPIAPPHPHPSQLEAPKPPKKRFLERNDSIYSSNHDSNFRVKDAIVPYISPFDQDTLDRVIDEAFSENSNNSPSSSGGGGTVLNMCKYSNNNNTQSSQASVALSNPPVTSSYSTSSCADEPVDFSMNRTISTTSQQIINSLVEKMLSGPDNVSG